MKAARDGVDVMRREPMVTMWRVARTARWSREVGQNASEGRETGGAPSAISILRADRELTVYLRLCVSQFRCYVW